MKGGYFSRLVQQTGIAFEKTRNSVPETLERQSTKSEEHDAALSIGVEERFEKKPSQNQEPAERKQIASGMDVKISPETVRSQNEINRKELLESGWEIETNNVYKEQVQQPAKPLTSSDQVYRRDTSTGSKSTEQIFQEKTSQVYLKDVREWVAGTSYFNNEKIRSGDSIETDDAGIAAPRKENRAPAASYPAASYPVASYPKPVEQRGIEGPEIKDFHLSIGTISLTIEEPQKGTQGMEPPRMIKAESREQKETSRLSRHYIRI